MIRRLWEFKSPKHRSSRIHGWVLRLLGAVVLLFGTTSQANSSHYYQPDDFTLMAVASGQVRIAERLVTEMSNGRLYASDDRYHGAERLWLVDQGDWDEDGYIDAVVMLAHSGNCCPFEYRIISLRPSGEFANHYLFHSWSFLHVSLERLQLRGWSAPRWVFSNIEVNEGINTDDFSRTLKRFILHNGAPLLVETIVDIEIPAVVEIRSSEVETWPASHLATELVLFTYDLNNDGHLDEVRGTLWARWGRLMAHVVWHDGSAKSSLPSCKRLGVLTSETNGVLDMVCDTSIKLIWNGERFEEEDNDVFAVRSSR